MNPTKNKCVKLLSTMPGDNQVNDNKDHNIKNISRLLYIKKWNLYGRSALFQLLCIKMNREI